VDPVLNYAVCVYYLRIIVSIVSLFLIVHAGVSVYSLLLYTSLSPPLAQNMAVFFCITPRQSLYEKVCYHENLTIYADCTTEWLVSFLQNIIISCFEGDASQNKSMAICDRSCAPL